MVSDLPLPEICKLGAIVVLNSRGAVSELLAEFSNYGVKRKNTDIKVMFRTLQMPSVSAIAGLSVL